ncbi:hypothetical protein PAXRUDRAFT_162779, partial [Paxillus rubicundulus Ve08.2h10]
CYICLDGGEDLYCCMQCLQVICDQCILVLAESCSQVREADMDFTCPVCYEATDRENSGQTGQSFTPYWVNFTFRALKKPVLTTFPIMSSCTATTAGSQVNCEPLLIINYYCKGMDLQGSLPQAITDYLWPYFQPGDLQFLQSEFDFATHAKIDMHREKMQLLREGIHGVLLSCMVIFISTDSNEECGDLFAGQEGPETKTRPIVVNVDHFFLLLFQSGMDHFPDRATLVLLTCGWLVKHKGPFDELHSSLCFLQILNCVAFTAHCFQSTLSTRFLQVLIFNTFIEGTTLPSSIPFSLENSFQMGQHMDVLLFSLTKAPSPLSCGNFTCNKFIRWSKQTRPYGTSLPLFCPVCRVLRSWDQLVWSGSVREGSWSVACGNPRCSLDGKGVGFAQHGALSGVQPEGSHFITAKKKRPSGWMG